MKFTKLCMFLAAISALALSSDGRALAGSTPANLTVSATVNNNCSISTVAVSFNPYDPLSATPDDSIGGSVTITCTKNSAPTIGLGFGQHESPTGQANMSDGTNPLMYALYKDAPGGAAWGNSGAALFTPPVTPSKSPRTYPVYGRISAGQDVPSGTYNDIVVATVNF